MDVRLEDGTVVKNVPDGMTQSELMVRLGRAAPVEQPKARLDAIEPPNMFERTLAKLPGWMGNTQPVRGVLQGAVDPVLGAVQLATLGQSDTVNNFIKAKEKEYQDSRGNSGDFDAARLIGGFVAPTAMIAGGGAALSTARRIGQGAKIGAASAAANPVLSDDFFTDKAGQVALGGVLGAGLPAGWELAKLGGRGARNVAQSLTKGGVDRIVGRQWNINAADKRDEIIDLLTNYKPPASGAPLSAGQVAATANRAEVAALQQLGENANPSLFRGEQGVDVAQHAARAAHLNKIAQVGTTAKEDTLDALRKRTLPDRFQALDNANKTGIASQQLTQPLDDLLVQPGARASDNMQKAIGAVNEKIKSLTNDQGVIDARDLDTIRKELGTTIANAIKSPDGQWDKKWAAGKEIELKKAIDAAVNKAAGNNQYTKHMREFSEGMKDVNDITVGRELDKALVGGSGEERAKVFLNAVKTATQSPDMMGKTGVARVGNIDDAMTPRGKGIKDDLVSEFLAQRNFEDLAKGGMSQAVKNVGVAMPEISPTGMFNPKISVMRALANRFIAGEHGKVLGRSGEASLDPQLIGKLMQNAKPFKRQTLVDELMKLQAAGLGQQP